MLRVPEDFDYWDGRTGEYGAGCETGQNERNAYISQALLAIAAELEGTNGWLIHIQTLIMNSKGYTLIELLIAFAICGIGAVLVFGIIHGNTIVPSKQSCMNACGKWSEGIQYGRLTQLCTYN